MMIAGGNEQSCWNNSIIVVMADSYYIRWAQSPNERRGKAKSYGWAKLV